MFLFPRSIGSNTGDIFYCLTRNAQSSAINACNLCPLYCRPLSCLSLSRGRMATGIFASTMARAARCNTWCPATLRFAKRRHCILETSCSQIDQSFKVKSRRAIIRLSPHAKQKWRHGYISSFSSSVQKTLLLNPPVTLV